VPLFVAFRDTMIARLFFDGALWKNCEAQKLKFGNTTLFVRNYRMIVTRKLLFDRLSRIYPDARYFVINYFAFLYARATKFLP